MGLNSEIYDWYDSHSIPVERQVEVAGLLNLSRGQMENALNHCYRKVVLEGKNIPSNQLARYVRNVAMGVDTVKTDEEQLISQLKTKCNRLVILSGVLFVVVVAQSILYIMGVIP